MNFPAKHPQHVKMAVQPKQELQLGNGRDFYVDPFITH